MKITEIRGTRILILGYGREGQSVHQWLVRHIPGVTIGIADKKPIKPVATARMHSGDNYLGTIREYDTVVRSPGIPAHTGELVDFQKHGGWVTSAVNIFFSLCPGVTIGVTGTKGKSTTSSLIAHVLAQDKSDVRLIGNIGKPSLDHLDTATVNTVFVIELSSHQLDDIRYSPHVAVILGIAPEHLDYYESFQTYVAAKGNIVRFQTKNDTVVFDPLHSISASLAGLSLGKKVVFALSQTPQASTFFADDTIYVRDGKAVLPVITRADMPLLGNVENILAAVAVSHALDVPIEKMSKAIKSFTPLPHRLEFVGEFRGIRFYNDSLATIPEAAVHALEALGDDVATLIAGGYDRKLDFSVLGDYLAKHPIPTLILFPDTGKKIWNSMKGLQKTHSHFVNSMEEAVALAYEHTPRGKVCLLSPASASFNMFNSYEDRGNQFIEWVKKLGGT